MRGWVWNNSLWLVGVGLMLASSGIDGAYMARWTTWPILGYVLNTTADVCSEVLMYWYGRFQQDRSDRKRRLSAALLAAEAVAVGYSWLFSWRQLRVMLQPAEPTDWQWVAPLAAGFIPLLLAFIGYAQSLLAGRIAAEPIGQRIGLAESRIELTQQPLELIPEPPEPATKPRFCVTCGKTFSTQGAVNAHQRMHRTNGNGREH